MIHGARAGRSLYFTLAQFFGGGSLFTGPQSVLAPERLAQLQANYANNKAAFDHFRHNIDQDRMGLSLLVNMTLRPGATTAMVATVEAVVLQSQVELAYDASRPTVERVINAAEHAAGQAYETLTHPGQWFGQSTPAASTPHPAVDRQHAQQHQTDRFWSTSTPGQYHSNIFVKKFNFY